VERSAKAKREQEELAFRQELGKRILELRQEMGLNQDEFAYKAGLHRSHIGQLENAHFNPRVTTLLRIAKALEVELWELLNFKSSSQG
jgi:transcriptional regulator with XRE-family HTH domain